jgi:hypothetical protein
MKIESFEHTKIKLENNRIIAGEFTNTQTLTIIVLHNHVKEEASGK